jgi:DUF4097 and DUF4098 domain-containing protein YvlB
MNLIRRSLALVSAAGMSLSFGGCMMNLDTKEQVTTIPVPHVAGSGLKVTAHNGHIDVKKSGDSEVKVVATLRMTSDDRLKATTISATRDDKGVLVISATPPSNLWNSNEGCGFDITLPDASGVTLKTDNGSIQLTGLQGKAELNTSNGSITISSQDGPIHAETSNGRVEAIGATGKVDCSTSNGSVKVSLAPTSPGPVKIDTSNGSITLELGKAFVGAIEADTSNGSITTPDAKSGYPTANIQRQGKTHVIVTVGSGPKSTLDTSNGRITIKFAD